MTISIKKVIDVSSILPVAAPGRRDFAQAIIIQKGNGFSSRVKGAYSDPDSVLADLGSNSAAYKASLKWFSGGFNGIKPTSLYVGLVNNSGLTNSTQGHFASGNASANLSNFQAADNAKFQISKDGSDDVVVSGIDFTDASSLASVATILQSAIRMAGDIFRDVTVTYATNVFTITSGTYGSDSAIVISAASEVGEDEQDLTDSDYLNGGSSSAGTSGTLASIISAFLADNRYYHIMLSNEWSETEILQWSSAIQAATRISYFLWALTTTADVANQSLSEDTSTIARKLFDLKASKTALIYDATNTDYKQAALPSYFATVDFTAARPLGSLAWKQYSGIVATDLIDSQFDNLMAKNVNFYSLFGEIGRNISYPGKACSGQFIHDVIAVDWIDYNMTYNIFDLMVILTRFGYDKEDFAKLEQAMEEILLDALASLIIAPGTDKDTGETFISGYKISLPKPEAVSPANKGAGILKNITTTGLLRGSAIKFVITNTLKF